MNREEVNKLTHKIIGCAMEVHSQLGSGFQEVVYQRSLAIEMALKGLSFEREFEIPLEYKGQSVGTRRVDFIIEGIVMLEIKAIGQLEKVHKTQAINYCDAYNISDGLLINFGTLRLEYHRVFNKRLVRTDC